MFFCCALFCRWEWILLGQGQAPVSHHDRLPAQHWSPHAVGAVRPWERTPAQPSPAEPPAHQQYVLGSHWEKTVPGALLEAGLAFLPSLREGGDDGRHVTGGSVLPLPAALVSHVQATLCNQSKSRWLFLLGIVSLSLLGLGISVFSWHFCGLDWKEK